MGEAHSLTVIPGRTAGASPKSIITGDAEGALVLTFKNREYGFRTRRFAPIRNDG
jgi:hypothetical protein